MNMFAFLFLLSTSFLGQNHNDDSISSHIEYGEYIVMYKYGNIKDSLYCPNECFILNLNNNNRYYFYPNRNENAAIIAADTSLIRLFGTKDLYLVDPPNFFFIKNTDSVNLFLEFDENNNRTKISSSCLYSPVGDDKTKIIAFKMVGFINVYHNDYQSKRIEVGLTEMKLTLNDSITTLESCIIFNVNDRSNYYAVYNSAIKFEQLSLKDMQSLKLTSSKPKYLYMKSIAY